MSSTRVRMGPRLRPRLDEWCILGLAESVYIYIYIYKYVRAHGICLLVVRLWKKLKKY